MRALIMGGGYIGLECAEQFIQRGIRTTVVEAQEQLMGPLDPEVTQPIQEALENAGATVILNDAVARIDAVGDRNQAILNSGRLVKFDLAIIATGVRPNVELAQKAGIALGRTGAIAVDGQQRTSDPAIYAAGDNCESVYLLTGDPVNIPLAGPANKQGRVAGQNAALDLKDVDRDDPHRLRMRGDSVPASCASVAWWRGARVSPKRPRRAAVSMLPFPTLLAPIMPVITPTLRCWD